MLCRSRWRQLQLTRLLVKMVVRRCPPDRPIEAALDATVELRKGKHVYGKSCHRDACRSSKKQHVAIYGHRWVVLAILVRIPFAKRSWALPVLVALYRTPDECTEHGGRHRTPVQLAILLLGILRNWCPDRQFVLRVDGQYSAHELASYTCRNREWLTLVGKFYPDAVLHEPAPPRSGGRGRPRKRGDRLPAPVEVVAGARPRRTALGWYSDSTREVAVVSRKGGWWRSGKGLVPVRWVSAKGRQGTDRLEYFFCADRT